MDRVFLLFLLTSLRTDFSESVRSCEHDLVPGSKDGPHGLECYFTGEIINGLNCSWTPGTHHTNATRYVLKIYWKEKNTSTLFSDITGGFYTIQRKKLYIELPATIWVETMSLCQKSKNITLIPRESEKPETPSDIKYSWKSGRLHLERIASKKYLYQITIRKTGTTDWQLFNFTEPGTPHELDNLAAYEFQARCKTIKTTSLWSRWSNMYYVPPELINKPRIYTQVTQPSLQARKRSVFIRWEESARTLNVSEYGNTTYNITIERLPAHPGDINSTFQTISGEHRLELSHASFKVRVQAFNSASSSPASEVVIPPFNEIKLRNKINATPLGNDSIFISWNSTKTKRAKYVVDWGPVTGNETHITHSKIIQELKNYTLKGKFEPKQRYRIMLHKRNKRGRSAVSESTIGIVDVYTVEGTPSVGPTNIKVTNILKSSATISWDHIPEDKCQGFLQGYNIFYHSKASVTKNLTNVKTTVSVNSSTTNYTLKGLSQKTVYAVEISGFTKAGEGIKSRLVVFETKDFGDGELAKVAVGVCVAIIIFVFLVTWTCSLLVKRIKKLFWPTIPNPGNSHAIQIIGRVSSMPHLDGESSQLNSNLLDIEREEELENLHTIEEITNSLIDYGLQENEPKNIPDQKSKNDLTDKPIVIPVTDYTTMENFQQIMPIVPSNNMVVQPTRSETEYNDQYQQNDTLILSYVKQRVHHVNTETTEGNSFVATECPVLLVNPDNITAPQALHSQRLLETNS